MTGYILAGIVLFLALAAIVFDRWRTSRTMKRLDQMLTKAMNGSFTEEAFDETRLSALESRGFWRPALCPPENCRNSGTS